nr:putative ribonuclease H-like domain-containing protein [Tanacetum cinerariifolium]
MDQQYPTVAKIPMLDTGKFEQWQFRMQQYLQHEHYALWEVIEFEDSYKAPENNLSTTTTSTTTTSTTSGDKSRRTVTLTTEDMQRKKNDVKSRTTLLISLPDEHQLRFSKHKTAKELWVAILKTFGGNEATKKTKKNRQLQFMGVEIEQDDLNQKFLTSLAPEWLMHTIVWRNRSDLDTMSLDDLYNHLKVYEAEVQKKSEPNTQNMAFISSIKHSRGNDEVNTASVYTASGNVPTASANVATINEDDIEEMDIKWNMALLSMRADMFWKKTGKKISIQGSDVAGFDKSKVECFNYHKMGHFVRECRAPRNQEKGRRDTYRQAKFPTANKKLSTTSRKFPTGSTKGPTADMGMKGKAVKPSACWSWNPSQNLSNKGPKRNSGSSQNYIDDKGYWDSGCSRHMPGNISYLSDYKPFDGGYMSFGQGGCKITGKGTINLSFENVYFLKDLREFSNARTPQQNGVAKRRNRSLIEAARTMLADAKLPVTFWAEAVNTACYVQNRVLVNKAHNKTPYELFNGRTPAIGFLKPFGCHVMILNTLDNLGKFEAKGDEGYFLGYSISSKAFRIFNKKTKRVEENMHIEFLENKAIEKGSGPNWLFDIDSLTKSMNYVPVVDAGTRNTDVPESSGNSNPTATSTNPSADQLGTLTVETLIPTFEDILGDTSNSRELNGVEADISNIETTITASPTPTLRIHRDHPKSQIIGPVDTPIQTTNKSKEVGEQSSIATIHQKTDSALLQFCLFSCFLSQLEPKKVFDALQDPSWVEAM